MPTVGLSGLADHLERLSATGDPLEALERHVDFEAFRPVLSEALACGKRPKGGRPAHDPVVMFKVLVLASMHNLSDERMAFLIRDRFSGLRFLGFRIGAARPDQKTIRLFRKKLTQVGAFRPLFAAFEDQLQARGDRPAGGGCTRTFLARELCVREDWRNAKGAPCLASARAVLPKLSLALGLPLRMLAVRVLEPDAENARRIATWYEKRGLIEEWFAALKVGTRIRDRRLAADDDLQRCLAFDAITVCTVMSIERLARSAPETRAQDIVHPDEIHVLAIHMDKPDHRRQRGPPNPNRTIAEFVVNTARLAGFIPAKRQPTPGTRELREGYRILALFVEHHRVMRDYPNTKPTMLQ